MKISIALATYNGTEFLREQIESLASQTLLPDELVVYDDCSTDGTRGLIARMAAKTPFDLIVLHGARNLGVNAAFQCAVQACRGEVVFFCDQDDIWMPEKIEKSLAALAANPAAGFVFSDAVQVNAGGADLGQSLWELAKFSPRRQEAYLRDPLGTMLIGGNFVYGMASAFRTQILRAFLPITCDAVAMTHDTWFALHAAASGSPGCAIPEPLVQYRRHANQTTAGTKTHLNSDSSTAFLKARAQSLSTISALTMVKNNVARYGAENGLPLDKSIRKLESKIDFLRTREQLTSDKSIKLALRSLLDLRYWTYASGPLSVARDYFAR